MSSEMELMELRARVARLEGQVEYLYRHLGLDVMQQPGLADERVAEALRRGNLIEAIKAYREIHNVGLAEAKRAVEDLRSRPGG